MHVLILGAGAGGGVPQWNCGCDGCRAARANDPRIQSRTQSSIAVSADGHRWLLLNASPDVRVQLAAHPELHPRGLRDAAVHAVALTNADIDHCLGLMVLREGGAPPVYGTARVQRALREGLRILPALEAYGPVQFREVHPGEAIVFADRQGVSLGITGRAFAVASKPPPYMLPLLQPAEVSDLLAGDTVGWVLRAGEGPSVVYVPGVKTLDARLRDEIAASALTLIDGTFFRDDEMVTLGASAKTAREMGHAPVGGDDGIVRFLASIDGPRKRLVHINNSNPMLWADSEARRWVTAQGVEICADGDRFEV
ncbi:MAG: pyrroloquinoline quinone biosynthesis protein PqqB [Polyangiales bacterium]